VPVEDLEGNKIGVYSEEQTILEESEGGEDNCIGSALLTLGKGTPDEAQISMQVDW